MPCYGAALFGDGQFSYRDAGHYYYPLHERVQKEWNAGRWPRWECQENAGMPLLGNPTAAVLYPGKVVFAILPYTFGLWTIPSTATVHGRDTIPAAAVATLSLSVVNS